MNRNVLLVYCLLLSIAACKTEDLTTRDGVKPNKLYKTDSGLEYMFTELGTGPLAKAGDKVSVHYIGKLTDGKEFDNSYKRGTPISFVLGSQLVIKGWEEGIALLHVGDKAVFTIPPGLGYGSIEVPGSIPANSVLVFEVELVNTEPGK